MKSKNIISENILVKIRRILGDAEDTMWALVDDVDVCEFSNSGDFVAEVCDTLKDIYIEHFPEKTTPKENDAIYYAFVDHFGKQLVNFYKKRCNKGLKESKKRIIVTESQYKRIFERKLSKIELFQNMVNDALETLRKECDEYDSENLPSEKEFSMCNNIGLIETIKITEIDKMDVVGFTETTPHLLVSGILEYSSLKHVDFNDIRYEMEFIIQKSSGGIPILLSLETKNINTMNQW